MGKNSGKDLALACRRAIEMVGTDAGGAWYTGAALNSRAGHQVLVAVMAAGSDLPVIYNPELAKNILELQVGEGDVVILEIPERLLIPCGNWLIEDG